MSKHVESKNRFLVTSTNSNLVLKNSSLVGRGLELVSKLDKKELRIAYADYKSENGYLLVDGLSLLIGSIFNEKYDIHNRYTYFGDELLKYAETHTIDIFILNLNCITDSNESFGLSARLEYSYEIITIIKRVNPSTLIIAFSGWGNQRERAKQAGVDFYFNAPFKTEEFLDVFERCIKMLPKVNRTMG